MNWKYYISHPLNFVFRIMQKSSVLWPDKIFLKVAYRAKMGKKLNLKNPKTFTEKIQWLKLYNRNPLYGQLVDKYAVKDYVAEKIGKEYVIPTIGVWDSVDDINFDDLPDKFVLKTTHGGGGGGIVICKDKSKLDREEAMAKLNKSLKADIYNNLREWPYSLVKKRIIAEELLEIPDTLDLPDYKFFCFNGEPRYIQVIQDRNTNETIDFFDLSWNYQEFIGLNPKAVHSSAKIERPANLDEMIDIARTLSKNTDFVRVDLYNVEDKVYFGELTFYPASGIGSFTPDCWNEKLGDILKLGKRQEMGGGGKYLIDRRINQQIPFDSQIKDYKFFCFNGDPKFFKIDFDRFISHRANYYDLNWHLLPYGEVVCPPEPSHIESKPRNFDKMVDIVKNLAKDFPFVRIDLYNINGKIYFGEITFFPASGLGEFTTLETDSELGELLPLKQTKIMF